MMESEGWRVKGVSEGLKEKLRITRLPGAVPQPLFLLLIVVGCIIFFEVVSIFKNIKSSSSF